MDNIGLRIRLLREEHLNLNQRIFARRIGISQPALAMFERGDRVPKEIHVKRICEEFDVNSNWLKNGGEEDDIFIKTDAITKAYNHFGYIMEHSSPYKKAALTAMIEMIDNVPDDKWEYIVDTFQNAYSQAIKETTKGNEEL